MKQCNSSKQMLATKYISRCLANQKRVSSARFLISSIYVLLSFGPGDVCFIYPIHMLVVSESSSSLHLNSSLVCSRIDIRSESTPCWNALIRLAYFGTVPDCSF
jgi:hypothetical protein